MSKLGSRTTFSPSTFPSLYVVKERGEKTTQRPVCVVCRRPLIFGMFESDGIMFEQETNVFFRCR